MKKNLSSCKPNRWSVLETNSLRTCNTCTLLRTLAGSLNDVYLLTLITKVEGILNSRPMAMEIINNPGSFQPPFSTSITSQYTDTKFLGLNYIEDGTFWVRNTCNIYKRVINGMLKEEIFSLVMLGYWELCISPEMNGRSWKLLQPKVKALHCLELFVWKLVISKKER